MFTLFLPGWLDQTNGTMLYEHRQNKQILYVIQISSILGKLSLAPEHAWTFSMFKKCSGMFKTYLNMKKSCSGQISSEHKIMLWNMKSCFRTWFHVLWPNMIWTWNHVSEHDSMYRNMMPCSGPNHSLNIKLCSRTWFHVPEHNSCS